MARTKKDKTYWGKNGKFQKDYNRIEKYGLVPVSGASSCLEGELLRSASSLYYDLYNNGCCNNRSGNWLFLSKHAKALKIKEADLLLIKNHSRGLRTGCFNKPVVDAYERIVDQVVTYIVKQEPKAKALAKKNKEKVSAKNFTPNTEDCLDNHLPDYEDENLRQFGEDIWGDDEDLLNEEELG